MNDQFISQMYDNILDCGIYDEKIVTQELEVSTMKKFTGWCLKKKRNTQY